MNVAQYTSIKLLRDVFIAILAGYATGCLLKEFLL